MKIDSSNALQILVLIGGLSLIPAILFTVTGFTRILIVLGFIRSALGTNQTPPNQVLVGIALFLTLFVMSGTISAIKKDAYEPLQKHEITMSTAITRAEEPLREFMFRQVGTNDLSLFVSLATQAMTLAVEIAGPMMLVGLVVGLVVSIFQAVTSIQEQSLSFIPKIIGLAALIVILGPWMLDQLVSYAQNLYLSIPQLIGG